MTGVRSGILLNVPTGSITERVGMRVLVETHAEEGFQAPSQSLEFGLG